MTTSSLEALRKYAQAMRVWDLRADGPTALTLLEEAVAADSGFAMAYRKTGIILQTLGLDREGQVRALQKAFENRDRLDEAERLLTSGSYFSSVTGDHGAAESAFRALLELEPDNVSALNNLAVLLSYRRDYAQAETLVRRCVQNANAVPLCWFNLADYVYAQGRAGEAWQVLERRGRCWTMPRVDSPPAATWRR